MQYYSNYYDYSISRGPILRLRNNNNNYTHPNNVTTSRDPKKKQRRKRAVQKLGRGRAAMTVTQERRQRKHRGHKKKIEKSSQPRGVEKSGVGTKQFEKRRETHHSAAADVLACAGNRWSELTPTAARPTVPPPLAAVVDSLESSNNIGPDPRIAGGRVGRFFPLFRGIRRAPVRYAERRARPCAGPLRGNRAVRTPPLKSSGFPIGVSSGRRCDMVLGGRRRSAAGGVCRA